MKTQKTKRTILSLCIALTLVFCSFCASIVASAENATLTSISPLDLIETSGEGATAPSMTEIKAYAPQYYTYTDWTDPKYNPYTPESGGTIEGVPAGEITYNGIRIPLSDSAVKSEYKLKGTFTSGFSLKYIFGSAASYNGDAFFVFKDLKGNELFRIGRTVTDIKSWMQMPAYVRYYDSEQSAYRYSVRAFSGGAWGVFYPWETYTTAANPDQWDATFPNQDNIELPKWGTMYIFPGTYVYKDSASGTPKNEDDKLLQLAGYLNIRYEDEKVKISHDQVNHALGQNAAPAGGDWDIGEIDCSGGKNSTIRDAMQNGFTVSVCKDRTVRNGTAPDVVLLQVGSGGSANHWQGVQNPVDLKDAISVEATSDTRIVHDDEYMIGSDKYIDSVKGAGLTFTKQRRYTIKDNSSTAVPNWKFYIDDDTVTVSNFDNKDTIGETHVTVEDTPYTVNVVPMLTAAQLLGEGARLATLESYDTTFSALPNQGHYTYKGIELPFGDATKPGRYDIAGMFSGESEIEYAFSSPFSASITSAEGALLRFVYRDTDGNEIFTVERTYTYWGAYRYVAGVKIKIGSTEVWNSSGIWDRIIPWAYLTDDSGKANVSGATGLEQNAISQRAGYIRLEVESNTVKVHMSQKKDDHTYGVDDLRDVVCEFPASVTGLNGYDRTAIATALNSGYTVSIERTADAQQNVLLTKINGVNLGVSNVSSRAVTPSQTRTTYDGEYMIGSDKYIDSVVGKDLKPFAKEKQYCVKDNTSAVPTNWKIYLDDGTPTVTGFNKANPGLQTVDVDGETYHVFVATDTPGTSLFTDKNLRVKELTGYDTTIPGLPGQSAYTYKGIELPFSEKDKPSQYVIPGTFNGSSKIEYAFSSAGDVPAVTYDDDCKVTSKSPLRFVYKDANDKEIFTIERCFTDYGAYRHVGEAIITIGGKQVLQSKPNKDSFGQIIPWAYMTEETGWNGVLDHWSNESKIPNPENYAQNGTTVAQRAGYIWVEVGTDFVKVHFSKKAIDRAYGVEDLADIAYTIPKTAGDLDETIADYDFNSILTALQGEYTVSIERTAKTQQNVLLVGINGKKLAEQAATYRNIHIADTDIVYDGYQDDMNATTLYVAQNGEIKTVTAKGYLDFAGGWKLPIEEKSELKLSAGGGDPSSTATGNFNVNMTAGAYGKAFTRSATLIVEQSRKLQYQPNFAHNGGIFTANGVSQSMDGAATSALATYTVYISEHTDEVALPMVKRNGGWKHAGWYSDAGLTTKIEGTKVPYTAGTGDITIYAKWEDTVAPVIAWKNADLGGQTIVEGSKGGTVSVSLDDVVAEDAADGNTFNKATAVAIDIKLPGEDTWTAFSAFTFDSTKYGIYTVRYTATDSSTNEASVERTILYINALPKITIADAKPTAGFVGYSITLPNGTSNAGDVTIQVMCDGDPVAITGKTLTFAKAGTYTVTYTTATDSYGQQAIETFDIVVAVDTAKPVIDVDFGLNSLTIGQTVTLPTATATDNADGTVDVTVTVTFRGANGEENVEIVDGGFTPDRAGVYTVTYSAKDKTNNVEKRTFEILSIAAPAPKGSNLGLILGLTLGIVGALLVAAAVVIVVLRKKWKANGAAKAQGVADETAADNEANTDQLDKQ